jgi:predicted permease
MSTAELVLVLLVLIIAGYAARRLKVVDAGFATNLSNFLFAFAFPAMILDSMHFSFAPESLGQAWRLVLLSAAFLVPSWLLAIGVNRAMRSRPESRGVVEFALMYSNFTFMAVPIVEQLYGKGMLFYLAVYTALLRVAYNSIGVIGIAKPLSKSSKVGLGAFLNPPLVAIVAGIGLYVARLDLPAPVWKIISMLSATVSPLGMVITGLVLAELTPAGVFKDYRVYVVSALRLLVIPALTLLIARVCGFGLVERRIAVLVAAMPVAATTVTLATKYGADRELAAASAFVSTLLSVATIPLFAALV